jgi:ferrochelatase
MKWLEPTTLEMIGEAVRDGVGVVITPIAFVSEHVETLVELDHDYGGQAKAMGCSIYVRAPALGVQTAFIAGLAGQIAGALDRPVGVHPGSDFICAAKWDKCPARTRAAA